ncbi:MAG TPA: hypothetical protein VLJ37_04135 [bacterium]|nr:hypothetical protein [bacterium]
MTTDEKIDDLQKLIIEQAAKSEAREHQLLVLIQEQGECHERRFTHIDDRFAQVDANFTRLDAKIDKVYESLSQDIQIFAEDLHHLKRRMTRLEKKSLS